MTRTAHNMLRAGHIVTVLLLLALSACAHSSDSRQKWSEETGLASWYGKDYHQKLTASGERYNMNDLTAAHASLPFGTRVKVTNLENGKKVTVRINDRGPSAKGRIIDVSLRAARILDMIKAGVVRVRLEVIE